jgi:hypothetical protein
MSAATRVPPRLGSSAVAAPATTAAKADAATMHLKRSFTIFSLFALVSWFFQMHNRESVALKNSINGVYYAIF